MRTKSIVFAALAGPLMIASGANAAFEDASVVLIDTADGLDTWHVIANFSAPTDELLGVGGVPGVG
ncbi:MAG: hypothetical protein KJO43_06040, partial [Phycisphaerae bacterium]|nr:hypothetical protein [Phycisphaerae bacterium]